MTGAVAAAPGSGRSGGRSRQSGAGRAQASRAGAVRRGPQAERAGALGGWRSSGGSGRALRGSELAQYGSGVAGAWTRGAGARGRAEAGVAARRRRGGGCGSDGAGRAQAWRTRELECWRGADGHERLVERAGAGAGVGRRRCRAARLECGQREPARVWQVWAQATAQRSARRKRAGAGVGCAGFGQEASGKGLG
ncbi:hypothetical protein GQ55_5G314700 [Panicum hallii var. hallii]|uniref:Uncharacterized protein n=1 Tax=Panicum hallii var. hallii TaxID=1504633 RepID=A0A2T7DLP7_9POAL|nr:hypothetical protein GQ55_5G314700 [Panicum hallii var. hallii]